MKFTRFFLFAWLAGLAIVTSADPSEGIRLGVPDFKPYTYLKNGEITGSAIDAAKPIFKALNKTLSIKQYKNYSLLLKAVRNNEIDGFFLATQNTERDKYAQFSLPLAFNNWVWFSLKQNRHKYDSSSFKNNALIATITKTNTFRWLARNGYQVHGAPTLQLPSLLMNKKVDAIFSAESVFEQVCLDQEINPNLFRKHIESRRPFGFYISKTFLAKHNGFMRQLNHHIKKIQKAP